MLVQHTQATATIGTDRTFLFDDTNIESISYSFHEIEKDTLPGFLVQNTSSCNRLSVYQEIRFRITQEFANTQQEYLESFFYDEEDLLDWDAAIITPPPRPSGTIRVKLKYKGRSKPFPFENFWEE